MSDKPQDKPPTGTTSGTEIQDIGQVTSAVVGHLKANTEMQKRTENVIQVFLGGAIASLGPEEKKKLEEEDEGAPPEAIGLAGYLEKKKKELLASGYTLQQAEMILMGQLGALSVYTAIANSEKKISIVRRVMAHKVREIAKAKEAEGKTSTSLGKTSMSHRDRARFAMRGRGDREKS